MVLYVSKIFSFVHVLLSLLEQQWAYLSVFKLPLDCLCGIKLGMKIWYSSLKQFNFSAILLFRNSVWNDRVGSNKQIWQFLWSVANI